MESCGQVSEQSCRAQSGAALFGSDDHFKLLELPQTTSYIPRATNAYCWAKGVVEQADTDVLFIISTVCNELMRAPQVSHINLKKKLGSKGALLTIWFKLK
jgi:hypothetical protein